MWSEVDWAEVAREHYARWGLTLESPVQMEQLIIDLYFKLYRHGHPCGAITIHRRLRDDYHPTPLPSATTIRRILVANGLTHSRTGYYPETDDPPPRPWRPHRKERW